MRMMSAQACHEHKLDAHKAPSLLTLHLFRPRGDACARSCMVPDQSQQVFQHLVAWHAPHERLLYLALPDAAVLLLQRVPRLWPAKKTAPNAQNQHKSRREIPKDILSPYPSSEVAEPQLTS